MTHLDDPKAPAEANLPYVTIVKEGFQVPTTSTSLAKIVAKDEPVNLDKGKAKLEIPELSTLGIEDLHQQYLTRLSKSREIKISMINAMKEKYEVNFLFYRYLYTVISLQGPVYWDKLGHKITEM